MERAWCLQESRTSLEPVVWRQALAAPSLSLSQVSKIVIQHAV